MRAGFGFLTFLLFAAAAQAGPRADLLAEFAVDLVDRSDAAPWTPGEAQNLLTFLRILPKDLRQLGARSRFGKINLLKSANPRRPVQDHLAPALLYWQVEIEAPPRTDDGTALRQAFIHHWLHVYDSQERASGTTGWRALSGWRLREYFGLQLPLFMKEADNQDPRGYASTRGLESPEEDFATFGEVYFVTPDSLVEDSIACRTPDKFGFFRRLFPDYKPYLDQPHIHCRGSGEGFLDDLQFLDPLTKAPIAMGPVDATTVSGFELLYATPGVGDASEIAGHLILRIKLKNNPEAAQLGIENPKDLVVSFLADTEDGRAARAPQAAASAPPTECKTSWLDFGGAAARSDFDAMAAVLQALKGLSGGFLTTFDRQTLYQSARSYTIDQDRNLLRYKLNLSEDQKARLIERLYVAKKNYRTKYYFFDRNCASILVQLIGEGIGDRTTSDFDPFVVPPNALVALLIRRGVATPVAPAFYSYRKKGQVAQEILRDELTQLRAKFPALAWPPVEAFLGKDEPTRVGSFKALGALALANPALSAPIYRLGTFAQDAELVHQDKAQLCERYTSEATAEIRAWQRALLSRDAALAQTAAVDTNQVIAERYKGDEEALSQAGSSHTNLSALTAGVGALNFTEGRGEQVLAIGTALHAQDMGSRSSQAMQRATSVVLGEARVDLGRDGPPVKRWTVTGLSIRKFKERLDTVPNFFDQYGTFGIGLHLLELRGRPARREVRGSLGGGELLFNLASSHAHDRYVFAGVGAALDVDSGRQAAVPRAALPLRAEVLWTFDDKRLWQLRADAEWRPSLYAGAIAHDATGHARLDWRAPSPGGSELIVQMSGEWARARYNGWLLGLELNRW